jgi:hypothetical protein
MLNPSPIVGYRIVLYRTGHLFSWCPFSGVLFQAPRHLLCCTPPPHPFCCTAMALPVPELGKSRKAVGPPNPREPAANVGGRSDRPTAQLAGSGSGALRLATHPDRETNRRPPGAPEAANRPLGLASESKRYTPSGAVEAGNRPLGPTIEPKRAPPGVARPRPPPALRDDPLRLPGEEAGPLKRHRRDGDARVVPAPGRSSLEARLAYGVDDVQAQQILGGGGAAPADIAGSFGVPVFTTDLANGGGDDVAPVPPPRSDWYDPQKWLRAGLVKSTYGPSPIRHIVR